MHLDKIFKSRYKNTVNKESLSLSSYRIIESTYCSALDAKFCIQYNLHSHHILHLVPYIAHPVSLVSSHSVLRA